MANELGSMFADGPHTAIASGAVNDGHAIKRTAALNTAEECDSAGEASIGVAMGDGTDGRAFTWLKGGRYDRAVAGAALATLHVELAVDTSGRYVAAVEGDIIVGINLTTAAGANSRFTIELDHAQRVSPST